MTKIKVLVADDEPDIRKLLERGLTSYGHTVITTRNGQEMLNVAARQFPDIILLDLNMENELDGLVVCQQLREWSKTPVIMLTVQDQKEIKLAALNAGADDYVTKPFDMDELEARMRAVIRRSANEHFNAVSSEIRVHDLKIDFANRRVTLRGTEVHLTPKEYDLLRILATNPGKVLTFPMLLEEVWGDIGGNRPEHHVRVYINTLRKKLHDDPLTSAKPRFIFNEPGIGYRFTDI